MKYNQTLDRVQLLKFLCEIPIVFDYRTQWTESDDWGSLECN